MPAVRVQSRDENPMRAVAIIGQNEAPSSAELFIERVLYMRITPGASNFLNASRWLAAFTVMAAHGRGIAFAEFSPAFGHSLWVKPFYFLTGLGHEAVMVFFVISGFLVGGLTLERRGLRGFDATDFFAHRTARIYTTYIPALLACALLDYVGLHALNRSAIYTDSARYGGFSLQTVFAQRDSLSAFFGNLFMLQGEKSLLLPKVEKFGTDQPLWSLSMEWWYYCLFAIAMLLLTSREVRRRALLIVTATLIALCIYWETFLWGVIWFLGVVCWRYHKAGLWTPPPLVALALFAMTMLASRVVEHGADHLTLAIRFAQDFMVGAGFSVLLVSVLAAPPKPWLPRLNAGLANFSYTLYLVHFPAMIFIAALAHDRLGIGFKHAPGASAFAYWLAMMAMLGLFAFGFYCLTEAHTDRVRRWLQTLWTTDWRVTASAE